MAMADALSSMEAEGRYAALHDLMHPDAQAVIPSDAVLGWYENEFVHLGETPARAVKVRFISWTWAVTGETYPDTAEVAMRQQLADGTVVRDEVRLVKDRDGNWGWFFGRDRTFVDEQIARYSQPLAGNVNP